LSVLEHNIQDLADRAYDLDAYHEYGDDADLGYDPKDIYLEMTHFSVVDIVGRNKHTDVIKFSVQSLSPLDNYLSKRDQTLREP
jgi:hypothetical protein